MYKRQPEEAPKTNRGRPTVLGKDIEEELVRYCLAMEASFFGLTRADLRRIAVQLAERNNIAHPFKDEIAGKKWVSFPKTPQNQTVGKEAYRNIL